MNSYHEITLPDGRQMRAYTDGRLSILAEREWYGKRQMCWVPIWGRS
jgi:hypothetical protein